MLNTNNKKDVLDLFYKREDINHIGKKPVNTWLKISKKKAGQYLKKDTYIITVNGDSVYWTTINLLNRLMFTYSIGYKPVESINGSYENTYIFERFNIILNFVCKSDFERM